jgi:hypothetical protein
MKNPELNRRDLGRLTAAALGGAIAGSILGGERTLLAAEAAKPDDRHWLKEPHLCCGLNTCKGHGKEASNDCAGRGHCATVQAHGCAGENACAGQGMSGENSCKGKGNCAVPLFGDGWRKARGSWEAAMHRAGKSFGPAPKDCGGGG